MVHEWRRVNDVVRKIKSPRDLANRSYTRGQTGCHTADNSGYSSLKTCSKWKDAGTRGPFQASRRVFVDANSLTDAMMYIFSFT